MKPEDWLTAGYRRFDTHNEKLSDFGLQKRFDDEKGKKYFITVYVYDRSRYSDWGKFDYPEQYGFMPTVQFRLGDNSPFFDITMNGTFDIEKCEDEIASLWLHFGSPYYEVFDDES